MGATKRKRSFVWFYFTKSSDNKFVKCQLCKTDFRYCKNTTNLMNHLQRKHNLQYQNNDESTSSSQNDVTNDFSISTTHVLIKQETDTKDETEMEVKNSTAPFLISHFEMPTISSIETTNELTQLTEHKKSEIDECLIKLIIKDFQQLSLVENNDFLAYTKKLQPLYNPPSVESITLNILPELYENASSEIKSALNAVEYVSLTVDVWVSYDKQSYLTVVCHFIYEDKMFDQVLASKEIPDTQNSENIASVLKLITNEWNITEKITVIVTVNSEYIKNAIVEHLKMQYQPCVADTLNLCVNEAINSHEEIYDLINKCRELVVYLKYNKTEAETLKETQRRMGVTVLKVKQDTTSRWDTFLIMINRLLEIKESLKNSMTTAEFLKQNHWVLLTDLVLLLKSIKSMVNELSSIKYPCISLMIPLIRGLQYTLKNKTLQTETGALFRNALLKEISIRLGFFELNKITAKATFLDPRFKQTAFSTEENAEVAQKWISEELREMFNADDGDNTSLSNDFDVIADENGSNSLWSHFDYKVARVNTQLTPGMKINSTLKQYLEMPHLGRLNNPLDFWKEHKNSFSELYRLQRKYLCIPATAVPLDKLFSKDGQLNNLRRSCLSSKYLDKIIFLNSYV